MSDRYKLVFRGEVLDGQHPAVVRKRLADSAGFADDALDKLFSGRPVVVKRQADTAAAARLQAVFKKAGARLRVLPVETGDGEVTAASGPPPAAPAAGTARRPSAPAAEASADEVSADEVSADEVSADEVSADEVSAAEAPAAGSGQTGLDLLPAGSDVLRENERTRFEPREVDTSGLKLEGARFAVDEQEAEATGPDVSHLSVAEAGTDLGVPQPPPEQVVQAPALDVAEAGSDLGPDRGAATPAVDVEGVQFEVAPAGSDMGQRKPLEPPPPPDVSHLSVEPAPDGADR